MKRWIHASHTYGMEPSGYEYGEALEQGRKRLQDRYEPFKIEGVYFSSTQVNSTGYRIRLGISEVGIEWIADYDRNSWPTKYKLYGPFDYEVNSWSELKNDKKLGEFKSLDSIMSYLFANYDEEIEEYTWDINDPLYAEKNKSDQLYCPNCNHKFGEYRGPRCPECGQKIIWD